MSPSALFVTTVDITLEAFLVPFARHFRALGWRVDALSNGAVRNERIAGAFDNRYDIAWSRNPLAASNLRGSVSRVRSVVTEGEYDLVHVHTPIAAFVTRYALRAIPAAARPVVIYTAHGFHFYEGGPLPGNWLFRAIERVAAPWTDSLVTINRQDYDAARHMGGIPPERVRYIPGIGVDSDRFLSTDSSAEQTAAMRQDLGVSDDAFMIAMIAELSAVKRHTHVLKAMAGVRNPDVVLVLVGDGPMKDELQERADALGVRDRVRFAGYRRDIPAILVASDCLVLASEREGLARAVLEGMAAGLPIIGTDTRGIADAVGPEAGWIVPKNDPGALAAAIDAAANDREEAKRRGTIARERATAEFALPRIICAYEELYLEALASRL